MAKKIDRKKKAPKKDGFVLQVPVKYEQLRKLLANGGWGGSDDTEVVQTFTDEKIEEILKDQEFTELLVGDLLYCWVAMNDEDDPGYDPDAINERYRDVMDRLGHGKREGFDGEEGDPDEEETDDDSSDDSDE